jgi:hypothetical protein
MTVSKNFGLLLVAGLLTPACALWGVEPEEIDLANETDSGYSAGSGNSGDGDGDHGMGDSGTEGEEDPTGPGDGDGDPGDGDGDPSTGDGDGDGDGDPSTGDGDPGDGDGDGETGDPGMPCELFEPIAVFEADNAIEIPFVMPWVFEGSCGSAGPDAVFSFTATSDATYEFTLTSNAFEGVLILVDGTSCDPLEEIACEPEGQAISHAMLVDEVVYIIVGSDADPGAATLSIAAI